MNTKVLSREYSLWKLPGLSEIFPSCPGCPQYNRSWLTADAIAGLTVWGLVVPESMAYAGVAGLPPQFGLYTLAVSLLVYALLGSSRHLFVQPTSATAALIASSVTAVLVATGIAASTGEVDPMVYAQYAGAFTLVVGDRFSGSPAWRAWVSSPSSCPSRCWMALLPAWRCTSWSGSSTSSSVWRNPQGIQYRSFLAFCANCPSANWVAFALGVVAMVLLTLIPRWNKKIPAGLIVLFGSIILSSALMLNANYGVEVVGELPQGLPSFQPAGCADLRRLC